MQLADYARDVDRVGYRILDLAKDKAAVVRGREIMKERSGLSFENVEQGHVQLFHELLVVRALFLIGRLEELLNYTVGNFGGACPGDDGGVALRDILRSPGGRARRQDRGDCQEEWKQRSHS